MVSIPNKDYRDDDKVTGPPEGSQILFGFKSTPESVPHYYKFGQWYHRGVHVLPLDEEWIRNNRSAYEHNGLYECEYVGPVERHEPFVIPEYIRVFDSQCSLFVDRVGDIILHKDGGSEIFAKSKEEIPGPDVVCPVCNKTFKEQLGWWGRSPLPFCSRECRETET